MPFELLGLAARVAHERTLAELARTVAEGMRRALDAHGCDFLLGDASEMRFVASADATGFDDSIVGTALTLSDSPLRADAVARCATLVIASPDDPLLTGLERSDLLRTGSASELWMPIGIGEQAVGAVRVRDDAPRDYSEILEVVERVAEMIAGAVGSADFAERTERQAAGLRELVEFGRVAQEAPDPDTVILAMADRLCDAIGVPRCTAFPPPGAGELTCLASATEEATLPPQSMAAVSRAETAGAQEFTAVQRTMAETISGIAILSIHNSRLLTDQQAQSAKLTALLATSHIVATTGDLAEALAIVARATAESLLVPECLIHEYDPQADTITPRAFYEADPSAWTGLGVPVPLADLPADRALLDTGATLQEHVSDPSLHAARRDAMEARGEKTCLTIPLRFGKENRGLMTLSERVRERPFAEEEILLARGYGEIAGAAIQNAQTLRRLEERGRRLASLVEAGQAMSADRALESVLPEVARQAVDGLGSYRCTVSEYVEETESIVERAYYSIDPDAAHESKGWAPSQDDWGLREILADPSVVERRLSDPDLKSAYRDSMERWGEKSCLVVPLLFHEQAVGLLTLAEIDHERHFGDDEREFAAALAKQAAAAIHNARQFARLEEQNRVLAALLAAGRTTTETIRLSEVLPLLVRIAAEALESPFGLLWEYEAESETLVEREAFDELGEYQASGEVAAVRDRPELARALFADGPIVETLSDPGLDPATRAAMEKWGEKTRLSVPLAHGKALLGILVFCETREERAFTPSELGLAAGLAYRAAIALRNARLFADLEDRNRELADRALRERLVNEASAELSSSLELDRIMVSAAHRFAELPDVHACDIYELRPGDELVCIASVVDGEDFPEWLGMHMSIEDYQVDRLAIESRGPIVVDSPEDPRLTEVERETMRGWGTESILAIPLVVKDDVLGTVQLMSDRGRRAFTPDIVATAVGICHMTSLAMENARHFERLRAMNTELETRARREALVSETSLELGSTLDLDLVLTATALRFARCLDATGCDIHQLEDDELVCMATVQNQGLSPTRVGTRVRLADWWSARLAVETRTRQFVTSTEDSRLSQRERDAMRASGENSVLILPMVADDRVIGTIHLSDTRSERVFTDEDLATAEAVCRMAALAIDNANLFARQALHAHRLASLLGAGRSVTSSIIAGEVLSAIAQTTAEALGSPECIILDYDAATGTLTPTALFQKTPAPYDKLGRPFPLRDWPAEADIIQSREVRVETISDPGLNSESRVAMERWGEKTRLSAPLHFGDEALGALVLIETAERDFTAGDLELFRGLSEQAAIAVHNARVFEELKLRTSETQLLNDIARETSSSLDVEEITRATIAQLHRLMRFTRAGLLLVQKDGSLDVAFTSDGEAGLDRALLAEVDLPARLRRDRIAVVDLPEDASPESGPGTGEVQKVNIIGLYDKDSLIGALALSSSSDGDFQEIDLRLMEGVGAHLSLAIKNARLYETVRELHLGSLRALSSALTAKDYYTLGHTARVATYASLVAEELGWSGQAIAELEEVAYLHDIGKLAVPDRVLLKSGTLNDEEWALMKMHPAVSAEIVEPLVGERLVAGVRHHHEWYDGSGYPDGLAGDDIPEIARLMCVVDAYDAMSSRRSYGKALCYDECLAELEASRGTQFDPQMSDALLRVLADIETRRMGLRPAAEEAAARIDSAKHSLLCDDMDETRPEYAEIGEILREVRARHPQVQRLLTETQVDDRRLMIVVDSDEDPVRHADVRHLAFADNEELEMFADHQAAGNVVDVDAWGTWLTSAAPVRDEEGAVTALVSAYEAASRYLVGRGPVSDVVRTFAGLARSAADRLTQAEVEAVTDSLTGLYNHRYLQQRLETEVEQAGNATSVSLLFCDIDHFKGLNDSCGHAAGDTVLRAVADIISRSARRVDIATRYGGDEFAVVLMDTGAGVAAEVAERIRSSVELAHLHPRRGAVTLSIGIATMPANGKTKESLIESADLAMYRAKNGGRNRCVAA